MGEPLDVTSIPEGTMIGERYRVVSTIGVGGMGAVVACEDTQSGEPVALKFLLPELLERTDITKRFLREARTSTSVDSDHVAKVLDVDTMPDGLPFIVMELLEGEDLGQLVDAGREFSVEEAIDFVVQAGEALAIAHRKGIVHRDIKPPNLFLVERAEGWPLVKVLDFGISKLLDAVGLGASAAALTKTSAVLGSGAYMSPEQLRSAKKVDHRTDIYALGITLYELLAHAVPFQAEGIGDLTLKICMEDPDPIQRHRPDLPDELAKILETAYARSPDDRFQTIASFMVALAPFAAAETIPLIASIAEAQGEPFTPPERDEPSPFSKTLALDVDAVLAQAPQPARDAGRGASPSGRSSTPAPAEADAAAAGAAMPLTGTLVMDSDEQVAAALRDLDAGTAEPLATARDASSAGASTGEAAGGNASEDLGMATVMLDADSPLAVPAAPDQRAAGGRATQGSDDAPDEASERRGGAAFVKRGEDGSASPWRARKTEIGARKAAPATKRGGVVGWIVIVTVIVLAAAAIVGVLMLGT